MRKSQKTIAAAIAALSLMAPAAAVAQSSSIEGYGPDPRSEFQGQAQRDDPPSSSSQGASGDDGGSLPFTGLDLGLLAAAGVVLTGVGFGMRRLTRRPDMA